MKRYLKTSLIKLIDEIENHTIVLQQKQDEYEEALDRAEEGDTIPDPVDNSQEIDAWDAVCEMLQEALDSFPPSEASE